MRIYTFKIGSGGCAFTRKVASSIRCLLNHNLEEYAAAYLEAAGVEKEKDTPLFRTARGKLEQLTDRRMTQSDVYLMIRVVRPVPPSKP